MRGRCFSLSRRALASRFGGDCCWPFHPPSSPPSSSPSSSHLTPDTTVEKKRMEFDHDKEKKKAAEYHYNRDGEDARFSASKRRQISFSRTQLGTPPEMITSNKSMVDVLMSNARNPPPPESCCPRCGLVRSTAPQALVMCDKCLSTVCVQCGIVNCGQCKASCCILCAERDYSTLDERYRCGDCTVSSTSSS